MNIIKKQVAKLTVLLTTLLLTTVVFAQEKTAEIDVDINKGGNNSNWYSSPWVWIVGGAVFILLLVALLRGNNSKD